MKVASILVRLALGVVFIRFLRVSSRIRLINCKDFSLLAILCMTMIWGNQISWRLVFLSPFWLLQRCQLMLKFFTNLLLRLLIFVIGMLLAVFWLICAFYLFLLFNHILIFRVCQKLFKINVSTQLGVWLFLATAMMNFPYLFIPDCFVCLFLYICHKFIERWGARWPKRMFLVIGN